VVPRYRIGEQTAERAVSEPLHRPKRTGAGVVDALRTSGRLEMSLGIRRVNHCLEFGGVFAEIVPQRSQRSGFARSPCLRKLSC
jgi:hypothetical protein